MVHKNSVILVKARKASNTSGGYYFCILLVLISELIIYCKNRQRPWVPSYFVELASFFMFSLEQKDARSERKEQYTQERKNKKNIKEVTFSVLLLFCVTLP